MAIEAMQGFTCVKYQTSNQQKRFRHRVEFRGIARMNIDV